MLGEYSGTLVTDVTSVLIVTKINVCVTILNVLTITIGNSTYCMCM